MFHGNYCGPWWSDGKFQTSVVGLSEPIDEFDRTCQLHDASYARHENLYEADMRFFNSNIGNGLTRSAAAIVVGVQGLLRGQQGPNNSDSKPMKTVIKAKKNLREHMRNVPTDSLIGGAQVSAPASISQVLTAQKTRTRSIPGGLEVAGREYLGNVEGQGVSTYGLGKSALLAPAYFYHGILGQLARAYQDYRWTRLVVHYIPQVSTSTTGSVVMCSSDNITEPCLASENTSFLSRALVTGNGVLAPLWIPAKMEIETDNVWRHVDPTVSSDINENILAELQVYSQVENTQQTGMLWLEYTCQFRRPMLAPHLTQLPLVSGPGRRLILQDIANYSVGQPINLQEFVNSGLFGIPGGSIFRCVIDLQGSVFGAGVNATNSWKTATTTLSTAGTGNVPSYSGITITGGMVVYLALSQGNQYGAIYTSIEAAINGSGSGEIVAATSTTVTSRYAVDAQLVRLGVSILSQMQ